MNNPNEARVKCTQCDTIHTLTLETEEVDRTERQMGAEVQYDTTGEVDCGCGQEITYIQSEWEYPEGSPTTSDKPVVTGGTLV